MSNGGRHGVDGLLHEGAARETTSEVISQSFAAQLIARGAARFVSTTTSLHIQALPSSQPGGIAGISRMPVPAFIAAESVEPFNHLER